MIKPIGMIAAIATKIRGLNFEVSSPSSSLGFSPIVNVGKTQVDVHAAAMAVVSPVPETAVANEVVMAVCNPDEVVADAAFPVYNDLKAKFADMLIMK